MKIYLSHWSTAFLILGLAISGCSTENTQHIESSQGAHEEGDDHDHEHEHEHEHEHNHGYSHFYERYVSKTFSRSVKSLSKYLDQDSLNDHDREDLLEVIEDLPRLAAATDLDKQDWDQINQISTELHAIFIEPGAAPKPAQFNQQLLQLQELAEQTEAGTPALENEE